MEIDSTKDASKALAKVDSALNTISIFRGKNGAYTNALEKTLNNVVNSGENTQAAESRIRDADMASAVLQQAKNSILSQAATAMLANANANSNQVLSLLQ